MERLWEEGDEAVKPTNRHFNVLINAIAKSKHHFGARKAYDLLQKMQGSDNCKPDIITYTSVIECFSKSTDPQAAEIAEELLEQASIEYEETGDASLMPNLRTYTVTILALSKSPNPDSLLRAKKLLSRLVDSYEETKDEALRPNAYPYNYCLNCAANCLGTAEEKVKAFQLASKTYNEMRKSKYVAPDSFTYAFWFKCCNNLLPIGEIRTKCVTFAFEQCKASGLVTEEVLKRLLAGTPPQLVSDLLDIPASRASPFIYRNMKLEDCPLSWSRNIIRS
jgi:hypothetical protein